MKITIKTLILPAIFLLTGCGADKNDTGAYQGTGYSITCPDTYQVSKPQGADFACLSPKKDAKDTFLENINVVIEKLPSGFGGTEQYTAIVKKNFAKHLLDSGVLTIQGTKFSWVEYNMDYGTTTMHNRVYMSVKNGSAYVVTASMLDSGDSFKQNKTILENIVKTFKFDN
jgi:hypothetical protein